MSYCSRCVKVSDTRWLETLQMSAFHPDDFTMKSSACTYVVFSADSVLSSKRNSKGFTKSDTNSVLLVQDDATE